MAPSGQTLGLASDASDLLASPLGLPSGHVGVSVQGRDRHAVVKPFSLFQILAYLQNSSLPQPGRGMPQQACFPGFVVSRVVVLQLDYDHWIHLLDSRPTLRPEW